MNGVKDEDRENHISSPTEKSTGYIICVAMGVAGDGENDKICVNTVIQPSRNDKGNSEYGNTAWKTADQNS